MVIRTFSPIHLGYHNHPVLMRTSPMLMSTQHPCYVLQDWKAKSIDNARDCGAK